MPCEHFCLNNNEIKDDRNRVLNNDTSGGDTDKKGRSLVGFL